MIPAQLKEPLMSNSYLEMEGDLAVSFNSFIIFKEAEKKY